VIRSLEVTSFKCFEHLQLELNTLTLLTGENSGGKSSVIQALVLLAQTLQSREWGRSLLLEGPELALGTVRDVVNHQSARHSLGLSVATDDERVSWSFSASDRRSLSIELESVDIDGHRTDVDESSQVRWLLPLEKSAESTVVEALLRTSWITAERTGPREILPLRDREDHARVGHRGEWAAGLLYWRESSEIAPALCLPGFPPTLFHQTRARMHEMFPGCDLRVTPIEGVNAVALRFRLDTRSDFHRPQNVGFGLSQLFPVVVALLAAKPGDVLLIENPEVHLHPRAQQMIGEMIARFAAAGVQIIVESHSDHVLNGIRLAVKKQVIPNDAVSIHFFGLARSGEGGRTTTSPTLDADGRLDVWPEGFFDQFDLALSELL